MKLTFVNFNNGLIRFLHTLLISGMLAVLVFSSMGYLAVRLSWHGYVRSANGLDQTGETHRFFCLSTQAFQRLEWIEDDEFILNGNWYDVKHSVIHPDGYISLVAYADHGEKFWLDNFFSWEDHGTRDENRSHVSAPKHPDWYFWFPSFRNIKPVGITFNSDPESVCMIILRDLEDPPPRTLRTA